MAFPDNYYPFYYLDEQGEAKGASYEIVAQLCKNLGYEVAVTMVGNMHLMLEEMASGNLDISANLTATNDRRKLAVFTTTPHLYESQNLIARADIALYEFSNLAALAQYRFGPILGWTYGPQFDMANDLNKTYVSDSQEQLQGLLSGRFDFAVNNAQSFQYLAENVGVEKALKVLDPPMHILPVNIAVSKARKDAKHLAALLEKELLEFQRQVAYREILDRYGIALPSEVSRDE